VPVQGFRSLAGGDLITFGFLVVHDRIINDL